MVNKDFFEALAALEEEKGISSEIFIEALRNALASACKKQFEGNAGEVDIRIVPEKNSIKFFTVRTCVEEVTDPEKEISLADAQALKKSYKIGDIVSEEFTPQGIRPHRRADGKTGHPAKTARDRARQYEH